MDRVLVAVDDSSASLAAARAAVSLAARCGARLRVLYVITNGVLTEVVGAASREPRVQERRGTAAASVLRHVAELAADAGVEVETVQEEGELVPRLLAAARSWPADVIVLGRAVRHRTGEPYISSDAQRVLEFAEQPVLVVPQQNRR